MTIEERIKDRFFAKVRKTKSCWIWTGAFQQPKKAKYGHFFYENRTQPAHRISYRIFVGEFSHHLSIHHKCNNTLCVNPKHLEPMELKKNILLGSSPVAKNAKKTKCKYGHPFDNDNTLYFKYGRQCSLCRQRHNAVYRRKNGVMPLGQYLQLRKDRAKKARQALHPEGVK